MNKSKRMLAISMAAILSLGLMAGCSTEKQSKSVTPPSTTGNNGASPITSADYGSKAAAADHELTLIKMMVYAMQDEYLARAEYDYVLATFGDQAPFNNIIKAEEQHIAELKALFEKYNVGMPSDTSKDRIVKPASIKDALNASLQAENDNIEMYKRFIEQDLPPDVKRTFSSLLKASESHSEAFQQNLSK